MKYVHTFDIKSQQARIEKTVVDPYAIQVEDYEDINDIIKRAVKTKTRPQFGHIDGAQYDDALDVAQQEFDRLEEASGDIEQSAASEQSEQAAASEIEPELPLTQ